MIFAQLRQNYRVWLVVAVIALAFFIRVYRIDQVPASLYYDEVDLGLQARSLLETHKDYRGRLSPFYVLSFNDPRVPIPAYLTVLTTLIFQKEEYQVRMPTVILGTLSVLLVFLLVKLWTKSYWAGLLASLVYATNPWQIQNSRWALEQIYCGFFLLLALNLFFYGLKSQSFKKVLLGIVTLGLSVYTYRTMSLLSPLILVILATIFRHDLLKFHFKKLIWPILFYAILVLPFLYATTIKAPDIPRISQVGIFSDPTIIIDVMRDRELDSGDIAYGGLGNKPVWYSNVFHNKLNETIGRFIGNYLETFSTEFLFVTGTPNPRESSGRMGELLIIDLPAFLIGLFFISSRLKQKQFRFLLLLFLIAPIPSALTVGGGRHGSRLFIFSGPLLMIVSIGVWQLLNKIKNWRWSRIYFAGFVVLYLATFIFYLHQYFVHFPIESAADYGYGFKQAMLKISQEQKNYKHIYMASGNDPPMPYFLYWTKVPPAEIQDYGSEFDLEKNFNKPLDKYKTIPFYVEERDVGKLYTYLQSDTLYLLTTKNILKRLDSAIDFPPGVRVIDVIKYPNGQPAFYLIAKL